MSISHHSPRFKKRSYIAEVTNVDVLFGRGRELQAHSGNLRFWSLCSTKAKAYRNDKRARTDIAQSIINEIYARGGRFLRRRSRIEQEGGTDNSVSILEMPFAVVNAPGKILRKVKQALTYRSSLLSQEESSVVTKLDSSLESSIDQERVENPAEDTNASSRLVNRNDSSKTLSTQATGSGGDFLRGAFALVASLQQHQPMAAATTQSNQIPLLSVLQQDLMSKLTDVGHSNPSIVGTNHQNTFAEYYKMCQQLTPEQRSQILHQLLTAQHQRERQEQERLAGEELIRQVQMAESLLQQLPNLVSQPVPRTSTIVLPLHAAIGIVQQQRQPLPQPSFLAPAPLSAAGLLALQPQQLLEIMSTIIQ